MKIIIAALMLLATLTAAIAFAGGGEGPGDFGHMGALSNNLAPATSTCTTGGSTGIFDLTNTCNDIYLMTRRF